MTNVNEQYIPNIRQETVGNIITIDSNKYVLKTGPKTLDKTGDKQCSGKIHEKKYFLSENILLQRGTQHNCTLFYVFLRESIAAVMSC